MRTLPHESSGRFREVPAIIVGNRDLGSLRALARHARGPDAWFAAQLDADLQRAIVVPQAQVPPEIVRIGSRVAFQDLDTLLRREVVLSLPSEAGAGATLSVLSALGVALLGAAAGETVEYAAPNGRAGEVRVLSVASGGDTP